jgi:hypothetical protein
MPLLRADLALPSGVTGPFDLAPFARAAARRASEIGFGSCVSSDMYRSQFKDITALKDKLVRNRVKLLVLLSRWAKKFA